MSAEGADAPPSEALATTAPGEEEIRLAGHALGGGLMQSEISVPDIHCGACIQRIESALARVEGLDHARVNLSTRRLTLRWRDAGTVREAMGVIERLGYQGHLFDHEVQGAGDKAFWELTKALAVAAFGSMNIMMLTVGVWAGAEGGTRDLLHVLSGLIALPTLAYAGWPFYRSAWAALRHGRANMDVPIVIGVVLAFLLSVYDTLTHAPHAYFDAVTSLLFFLLIGRVLDHMMREKARSAVRGLARLSPRGAVVLSADGTRAYRPVEEIAPGMAILLAAGERVPVDARVLEGVSDIDMSLVNGESEPAAATAGTALRAGTLNLTGPLTLEATATVQDSFLAEMMRMMEAAEEGRSAYRRIADRVAQYYAPVVHLAAFVAFAAWMVLGADLHQSVTVAIAVLIITCPCALGLAVPMVHVVAARRLFESGIMLKDGSALERLAEIDTVLLDKTGTLTLGRPELVDPDALDPGALALAGALAGWSRHPQSLAISHAARNCPSPPFAFTDIAEHPGLGLEARAGDDLYRLGRAAWALGEGAGAEKGSGTSGTVLTRNGEMLAAFAFRDALRPGAVEAVAALKRAGLSVEILSGDRCDVVAALAAELEIGFAAEMLPAGKLARIAALAAEGRKPLMVGDGLNDGPALAAAHVSMAPANAADVGRNAADFVFLRDSLTAVPLAHAVARGAARLVKQNLALSLGYNVVALPIAVLGYVTPLVAALAMSLSSVVVVANALRLTLRKDAP